MIGVPDEYWGETLKAFVVTRRDASPSADDLLAHCRASLAGYKIPKTVEFIAALPRNTAGKVAEDRVAREREKMTIERHYVTIGCRQQHYRRCGRGPAVVLLHEIASFVGCAIAVG